MTGLARDEAALVIATAAAVQAVFAGSMPPLAQVITDPADGAHLTALQATAVRAGVLVALAAWLARSKAVAAVGGVLIVGEWAIYSRAAAIPPAVHGG